MLIMKIRHSKAGILDSDSDFEGETALFQNYISTDCDPLF